MKRFLTVCGLCLFVLGAWVPDAAAFPRWSGEGGNPNWSTVTNWKPNTAAPAEEDQIFLNDSDPRPTAVHDSGLTCTDDCDYGALTIGNGMTLDLNWRSVTFTSMLVPGSFTFTDTGGTLNLTAGPITINNTPTITHSADGVLDADSLTINASSVSRTLTLDDDGVFDIGDVIMTGGSSGSFQAKLVVDSSATNFKPDSFDADGGSTAGREVVLDFDASVTVDPDNGHAAPDTIGKGYVDFDIAASTIFRPKDMKVDASAAFARIKQLGAGEVEPTSLTISAGDATGRNALYLLSAGTLDVKGEVQLNALSAFDAFAEIQIDSGTTFTVVTIDANGGSTEARRAEIDANAGFSISDADTDADFKPDGYVKVDLASGVCVYAGDVTFADGDTILALVGAGTQPDFIVDGGGFQFNNGTLDMTGPVRMKHGTSCP